MRKKLSKKLFLHVYSALHYRYRYQLSNTVKKTYKVNIKLQINSIETNLYVHSIWLFFLVNMGQRGNICFLLVIVDPCNSQGVIITGNRALPVIKFTLFLESSKQLNLLAQKQVSGIFNRYKYSLDFLLLFFFGSRTVVCYLPNAIWYLNGQIGILFWSPSQLWFSAKYIK